MLLLFCNCKHKTVVQGGSFNVFLNIRLEFNTLKLLQSKIRIKECF